ncbi:MAG: ATP-binding protein [Verrucomicrobiae bacterium]|nr:ATP-binding protein [Verrucomicrobiae bacterium]
MSETLFKSAEIRRAFADYERRTILYNVQVGCLLGVILMPVGYILDKFVYPEQAAHFLNLRLLCSLLIGVFWGVVRTPIGRRFPRSFGVLLAMFPAFFITWMIYETEGSRSPYYAGLNLVLLVVGFVVRWSLIESLIAVSLVIGMYGAACVMHGNFVLRELVNNLYFLVLTGIIVATGSYFHTRTRFREFAFRYELDKSRQELEASNQKLKELDQIKSRFFANISHELRTPLTLLIAPLEQLLHRAGRWGDEDTRQLLQTMHSNSMRLLKLINDLLDLVRLESGVMQVKSEPLDVADFIKGIGSATRQVAEDKRIRLETHTDPALGTVLADRDKLEKILLNLVFNALKSPPAGGRVSIRAEKQGEELVLSVTDTGMGIAEKNLPFVFDRFWQADSSSRRKYQGVGIGLALVKELTEVQGGSVSVQSREGQGSTFTVRLPWRKAEPAQLESAETAAPAETTPASANATPQPNARSDEWLANLYRRAELFPSLTPASEAVRPVETGNTASSPSPADAPRPTVLVADDEPDMLRFLKSQLGRFYRVIEAVDGQQAVDKAAQFLPDLILLDMMMPEKDGLQACREIRERVSTHNIPIVLLTARADEETKLAALQAGASDFLTKPFSTTELHVRIKNLIESYEYQRKLARQKQALEHALEQLKETEIQLVQSEKLASLGRMSAGIIHEINNPLNFAATGLFTLKNKTQYIAPEHREEYADILKDVEEGLQRVKTIVSDLRMFTHPETEARDQVEVSEVVEIALRFLSNEWKDKVRIVRDLPEHQSIWANKNKLIHVLVNLLQNSLDAIRKKQFNGEMPTIWIEGRVENGLSRLTVRDNGPGIAREHLDKIFDPFFTTKDIGEGTGLGLSICYRIVQEYDGRIRVNTEPGKFCEFTLEFPAKGD